VTRPTKYPAVTGQLGRKFSTVTLELVTLRSVWVPVSHVPASTACFACDGESLLDHHYFVSRSESGGIGPPRRLCSTFMSRSTRLG